MTYTYKGNGGDEPKGPAWRYKRRPLSSTERRYMLDVACGLTAPQIAEKYQVSLNTVNFALKRGKAALGALSGPHAVALCIANAEFSTDDVLKGQS